jgi:hypothetical protein
MPLDDLIARHNADVFVREFTYSAARFKGQDGQERELCDGAVWIGDLLILLQNKERDSGAVTGNPEAETRWFDKKVSKLAVDQLCASLRYLEQEQTLPLANLRGQTLELAKTRKQVSLTHLVVLFSPSAALPSAVAMRKGRESHRAGFVHFISADDYMFVCDTLHTPFEISDYLSFRKAVALKDPHVHAVSEKAILGQYLMDPDPSRRVSQANAANVDHLVRDANEFSLTNILAVYLDRVTLSAQGTDYHRILAELAKLRRNMAREFRKRLAWAMDTCKRGSDVRPSRFDVPDLGCSYIFIPLSPSQRAAWQQHLLPMTHLSKYAFRSPKCIGLTVATDPTDTKFYLVNWLFLEFPWEADEKADELIRDIKPFREITVVAAPTYRFEKR